MITTEMTMAAEETRYGAWRAWSWLLPAVLALASCRSVNGPPAYRVIHGTCPLDMWVKAMHLPEKHCIRVIVTIVNCTDRPLLVGHPSVMSIWKRFIPSDEPMLVHHSPVLRWRVIDQFGNVADEGMDVETGPLEMMYRDLGPPEFTRTGSDAGKLRWLDSNIDVRTMEIPYPRDRTLGIPEFGIGVPRKMEVEADILFRARDDVGAFEEIQLSRNKPVVEGKE